MSSGARAQRGEHVRRDQAGQDGEPLLAPLAERALDLGGGDHRA
jgi:hypothetical protein